MKSKPDTVLNRLALIRIILLVLLSIFTSFSQADDWSYTVRPGDNLWNITDKFLLDQSYRNRLQEYNNMPDGDLIQPGSLLKIPVRWLKVKPASAKLIAFSGTVDIVRGDGTSSDAPRQGIRLNAADSVTTSANSSATIEFADGSRVFLDPDTTVILNTISSYDQNGMIDTSFRLRGGRVESLVVPGSTPETRFRVLTPPAIASVKGTEFNVAYRPVDNKTLAEVSTGLIGLSAAGVEVDVPAGFGSTIIQGQAPQKPVKRLPAVELSDLQDQIFPMEFTFSWPAVSGTAYYLVELLEVQSGEFVLIRQISEPDLQLNPMPVNNYSLRIRAVDDIGLSSVVATHNFEVVPRPAAPLLTNPSDNSVHTDQELTFEWESDSDGGTFNLQLSKDASFTSLVIDNKEILQSGFLSTLALPQGKYLWRVSFTNSDGITSNWSDVYTFTVHENPHAPNLTDVSLREESLVTRWDTQNHAIAYLVEISTDKQFDYLLQQKRIEDTSYVLQHAPRGQLYVRVASFGREGFISGYSNIVSIEKKSFLKKYGPAITIIILIAFLSLFYRRNRKS